MTNTLLQRRLNEAAKAEKRARIFKFLFAVIWLFSLVLGVLTMCGITASLFAGLYYLCTGEFILQ